MQETLARAAPKRSDLGGYQELMRWRVDNIILVSNLYDSFMLAEDGHLNELILGDFLGLNLSHIPELTRVSTGREALRAVHEYAGHTLVIGSPHVGDMDLDELARRIRSEAPRTPIVLLAFDSRELNDFIDRHDMSCIDRAFLWQGDLRIVLAIVKYVEDRMNAEHDIGQMGVQGILVIEDSIRYYSSFLPVIYTEVVEHTRKLMPDGVNLSQKLLRIRARPKILLCGTFEEAWDCFCRYEENVLGVISDVEFPKDGESCADAGVQFAREVRARQSDVPVVLHSSRPENEVSARAVGADFLLKGSPTLLAELRGFMVENFGFGDFVFRLADGTEVGRAHDLKTLEEEIRRVPVESLAFHGARNHFSMWLKAHTEFAVAYELRPRKLSDFPTLEDLRDELIEAIRHHRQRRSRAVVADFDPATFDPERGFARIGGGSIGGKARGLAFVNRLLTEFDVEHEFPGVRIAVPTSVVLGTDVFDAFLEHNDLRQPAIRSEEEEDDDELLEAFLKGEFPADVRRSLAALVDLVPYPLAVRSSSLHEDSKYQPFAGVYETLMLPNNDPHPGARLEQLLTAVKKIYASTFSGRARAHMRATAYRLEEEKMAVILQRLVGSEHGGRFYPEFAGVAMSHNYYPSGPMRPEDGIVSVALGLGPAVVGGGECVRFCPRYPQHLVQFSSTEDIRANSQREFFALRLDGSAVVADGGSLELDTFGLETAGKDGTLRWVGSTYSPENDVVYDDVSRSGVRLVTFAPVLKHGAFPLPGIFERLLEIGVYATGLPVEIEFAVNLSVPPGRPKEFALLQLRPVGRAGELQAVEVGDVEPADVICHSSSVLGNGKLDGIRDVVFVDYHSYERNRSRAVVREVAQFNGQLQARQAPYVLIGVGRWGSRDPLLGIPVSWEQISGARVIVEAGFKDFTVEPSQGSHFFQNLMSHSIGYFTANPEAGEGYVDWDWLAAQDAVGSKEFVRHLRFDEPIVVKMNGTRNEGVILKPGVEDGV